MQITDDAIKTAVELSDRYITGRCLPDKAIDVIDEAGARVRLKTMSKPPNLKEIDDEVEQLNREKEEAVANQDFEKAAAILEQAIRVAEAAGEGKIVPGLRQRLNQFRAGHSTSGN